MTNLRATGESGSALLPVLLLMFLFSAIALGAAVVARMEILIADHFRQSAEALHAAEAALDLAISELRTMGSWTAVLNGGRRSVYSEGLFSGSRKVTGGGTVLLCCGASSVSARLTSETTASALPARRLVAWQPFLWAQFNSLVPQEPPSRLFVVAFVGEDEEEAGVPGSADENETLVVRAEAVDPGGTRRSVEALVARRPVDEPEGGGPGEAGPPAGPVLAVVRWREVR